MFNAELYVMGDILEIALPGGRTGHEARRHHRDLPWTKIHIWHSMSKLLDGYKTCTLAWDTDWRDVASEEPKS